MVGFYFDREEFANSERFPDADEILTESFYNVFNSMQFTGNDYIVILQGDISTDVLKKSLKKKARYIGMIGSKRKVKIVLGHMKEIGFDHEAVDKVHSSAGVSISAETPQEIAVSIAAQLVKVRRE